MTFDEIILRPELHRLDCQRHVGDPTHDHHGHIRRSFDHAE
jgi:hypothetical protein